MTDRAPQVQDKFVVRLPNGLRDRIKLAAEASNRSMNAEIVWTLEAKYPHRELVSVDEVKKWILDTYQLAASYPEVTNEDLVKMKQELTSLVERKARHGFTKEELLLSSITTLPQVAIDDLLSDDDDEKTNSG